MTVKSSLLVAAAAFAVATVAAPVLADSGPTDAQIAHIAYTAGAIDVAAGKQALAKSSDPAVRAFAEEMVRDHGAVNDKALALVKKLGVTPEPNPTSAALSAQAEKQMRKLGALDGAAFDKAYVQSEIAYHQTVNTALRGTLIPQADNAELKSLLETGLTLFQQHQQHAEHLAQEIR